MNAWEWLFTLGFFITAAFVGLASHEGPFVTAPLDVPQGVAQEAESSIQEVTDQANHTLSDTRDTLQTLSEEIQKLDAGVKALKAGGDGLKQAGNSVSTSWSLVRYLLIGGLAFLVLLGLFVGYQAWRNRRDSYQTMLVTLKLAESMEAFKEAELSENELQREMLDERTSE